MPCLGGKGTPGPGGWEGDTKALYLPGEGRPVKSPAGLQGAASASDLCPERKPGRGCVGPLLGPHEGTAIPGDTSLATCALPGGVDGALNIGWEPSLLWLAGQVLTLQPRGQRLLLTQLHPAGIQIWRRARWRPPRGFSGSSETEF